jgi:hypothetical protein
MDPQITVFLTQQFLASAAAFLVYFVGLVLGLIFIRKYTCPAILTIIAVIILFASSVGVTLAQAYLMQHRMLAAWSNMQYGQLMSIVSISGNVIRAIGLALLLAAVFVGRKSKTVG